MNWLTRAPFLLIAVIGFGAIAYSLKLGCTRFGPRIVKRAENPVDFWIATIFYGLVVLLPLGIAMAPLFDGGGN